MSMLRLLLWLLAAVSLGDVAPATGAAARDAAAGTADRSDPLMHGAGPEPIALVEEDRASAPIVPVAGSAVDSDAARTSDRIPHHGRTPAPHAIVAAQLPDGRASSAFNSRAPPLPA